MPHDDETVARITGEAFDAVLDKGAIIHFVPADAASVIHQNRPYAYTVGRTLMERPEFLVTGLDEEQSKAVLTGLITWDDVTGNAAAGAFVVIPPKVQLLLADSHPLLGALTTFGLGKVRVLQALWPRAGGYPDASDRWPDQPIHPYGETPLSGGRDPYAGG
jgi:hypothetical protein